MFFQNKCQIKFINKGLTLVEVLIAISLFTIVSVVSSGILKEFFNLEKKSNINDTIYEDAGIIFQKLAKEIHSGSIDYEEYFSTYVVQRHVDPYHYGLNYGVYASRFFNPGQRSDETGANNPRDLGIECSYPVEGDAGYDPEKKCEIYYSHSGDQNTGRNFHNGDSANAFCDDNLGVSCESAIAQSQTGFPELFLIDSSGTHKTILARKKTNNSPVEYGIGLVRMTGSDMDQNGIVDVFRCDEEFKCDADSTVPFEKILYPFVQKIAQDNSAWDNFLIDNEITLPKHEDLETVFNPKTSQFVPITPSRVNVTDLKFIINPLEDPYKAYAEYSMQSQPSVTIVMTLELTAAAQEEYPGDFQPVTVQTTVSAGVIGKIESYPPVNDVLNGAAAGSWIDEVL